MVPGKGPVFPNPLTEEKDLELSRLSEHVDVKESLGYDTTAV
jgi:hypothetical protein